MAQKKSILVMDDDKAFREVMNETLDCLGYTGIFVENGEEALKYYKEADKSGKPFDAVIMDLKIKRGINGEEGAKLLLKYDPKVKIVISSGFGNHPLMQKPQDFGIQGVLLKPFGMPTLQKLLKRILEE